MINFLEIMPRVIIVIAKADIVLFIVQFSLLLGWRFIVWSHEILEIAIEEFTWFIGDTFFLFGTIYHKKKYFACFSSKNM